MEANWTDPLLFFIYSVAKPLSAALILVVMLDIISGGVEPGVPRLRRRRDGAVVASCWPGSRDWPGRSSTTASATGCSSTCTSARATSWSSCWAAASRASAVGAMGAVITIVVGILVLGVAVRPGGRRLAAARARDGPRDRRRSSRSASCSRPSASRPARSRGHYPEAVAGRPVPRERGRLPAVRAARRRSRPSASLTPLTVVDRGRPARGLPGRAVRRSAAPEVCGLSVTGTAAPDVDDLLVALLVTGALVTLAATGIFRSSERRAKDRGLLDQTTGS